MATQITCDRCRNATDGDARRFSILPAWYVVAPCSISEYQAQQAKIVDLCQTCYGEFGRFINPNKEMP